MVGGVVADERIIAGRLTTVKIERVRSPMQLGDAVPVPLSIWLVRILKLHAVEPAALILGVEHSAGNQRPNPSGEIAGGRNDAPGRCGKRMVQVRVIVGQNRPGPGRSLDSGRIGRLAD